MNLQIELSTVCNWDCNYCPRPSLTRMKEFISYGTFHKAVDTFIEETTTLILSKDGEPLMHPDFGDLFAYAVRKYTGKIDIYTNGVFLTNDILDILGAASNNINIFITDHITGRDGIQDSTKTLTNFTNAVNRRYTNISFTLTRHSFNGQTKEDEIWLRTWNVYKHDHPSVSAIHLNQHRNSWAGFVGTEKYGSCPFMEYEFIGVGITGNVTMCCLDLNEELTAGNILADTKESILAAMGSYKQLITTGDVSTLNPCNRCVGVMNE